MEERKRKREDDSAGDRGYSRQSEYKRRKRSHRTSPMYCSSPTQHGGITGGRNRSRTGDVECILKEFVELKYRVENIEEKLNSVQYMLKNIERFVENRKLLPKEKKSQLCIIM